MKPMRLLLTCLTILASGCGSEKKRGFDFSTARGFNLIELSGPGWYPPGKFEKPDFEILEAAGFNHVRIMLDYRLFTVDGNIREFSPEKMEEVDKAIRLARQHGLHASICLFSVPGYSVHEKIQNPSLWDDGETQKVFVGYWKAFTARYRGIPPAELSFNLINEPPWGLEEKPYADLMLRAIKAIRETDPDRQIVIDGLDSGRLPVMSLADEPNTVQSAHFYEPFPLTHYSANWVEGTDRFPAADRWPLAIVPAFLFGPKHAESSPLMIRGDFSGLRSIRIVLDEAVLSESSPVVIAVKGEGGEIARETVKPQDGWKVLEKFEGSEIARYQTGLGVEIPLPEAVGSSLEISVETGDRVSFREIGFPGVAGLSPTTGEWLAQPGPVGFSREKGFTPTVRYDRQWIVKHLREVWKPLQERGVPVVVQEFGVNHSLPHDAALAYVGDCISAFGELGFGWCYFSNIGNLGVIDSQRSDTQRTTLPNGRRMDDGLFRILAPHPESPD